MALPTLTTAAGTPQRGVTLAVYAPFGTDATLSRYPGTTVLTIQQHPLVANLVAVAQQGVHVSALIDLQGDDTWLVEVTANVPTSLRITSCWKQDMDSPNTLSGFLRRTRTTRPDTALVLAMEGHGAGYLPEIDTSQLTTANLTQNGTSEWLIQGSSAAPRKPGGAPLLPMGCPLLPMGCPLLPVNHMPLSTWGLGQALRATLAAGGPPLGVIHLDNCFNMSVELLHTIAPFVDCASSYLNYNFFTAGSGYAAVFQRLKAAGNASALQLATWFAEGNRNALAPLAGRINEHPTAGGVVQLSRLPGIVSRLDTLASALVNALTGATAAARPAVVEKIRVALSGAQQFDTLGDMKLEVPSELTDLLSLARAFQGAGLGAPVQAAAKALEGVLGGIKAYGASGRPWTAPTQLWDFSSPTLAMNILCPDPLLRGLWDWRSPYYLQPKAPAGQPVLQPQVIDFLKTNAWVKFIVEYHRDVPFVGVLPAAIPSYPVFRRKTNG